jgi:Ca-activated chloride channel family protein
VLHSWKKEGWEAVTGLRFSRVLVASVVALLRISLALADGADGKRRKGGCGPAGFHRSPPQSRRQPSGILPKADIRVDTTLVLIPVTVTDPLNRFVTGLEKENFRIFEDKVEQQIAQFSSEDAPLSVGIVFDCSGSMGTKLEKSRQAVAQFFKTANPEDEFFLVEFSDRADSGDQVHHQPGGDSEPPDLHPVQGQDGAAGRRIPGLARDEEGQESPQGPADHLRWRRQQQPLHRNGIKNLVREADVQIYAMGIFEPASTRAGLRRKWGGPAC